MLVIIVKAMRPMILVVVIGIEWAVERLSYDSLEVMM